MDKVNTLNTLSNEHKQQTLNLIDANPNAPEYVAINIEMPAIRDTMTLEVNIILNFLRALVEKNDINAIMDTALVSKDNDLLFKAAFSNLVDHFFGGDSKEAWSRFLNALIAFRQKKYGEIREDLIEAGEIYPTANLAAIRHIDCDNDLDALKERLATKIKVGNVVSQYRDRPLNPIIISKEMRFVPISDDVANKNILVDEERIFDDSASDELIRTELEKQGRSKAQIDAILDAKHQHEGITKAMRDMRMTEFEIYADDYNRIRKNLSGFEDQELIKEFIRLSELNEANSVVNNMIRSLSRLPTQFQYDRVMEYIRSDRFTNELDKSRREFVDIAKRSGKFSQELFEHGLVSAAEFENLHETFSLLKDVNRLSDDELKERNDDMQKRIDDAKEKRVKRLEELKAELEESEAKLSTASKNKAQELKKHIRKTRRLIKTIEASMV